jgi:hypothetical protein
MRRGGVGGHTREHIDSLLATGGVECQQAKTGLCVLTRRTGLHPLKTAMHALGRGGADNETNVCCGHARARGGEGGCCLVC